jgi:MFS family permease
MAHAHHHPVPMPVAEQQGIRRGPAFIIGGLTSGHGVFHWFTQSFIVMLPEVRLAFGLSAVQVGSITAVRELTSGIVSLPGGVLTDLLRRHWGLVLASCMALFGIGWLVMGFSPIYPLLLVGMAPGRHGLFNLAPARHGGPLPPLCPPPGVGPLLSRRRG